MTSPTRDYANIALIGFMGCGKSSVGQLVAEHLEFDFVDTDTLIEQLAGMSIGRIFSTEGEAAFRELETRVVNELAHRQRTVIATGGGLGAHANHVETLKTHALVVFLWASPEVIWRRVKSHSHRPLLQGPDPRGTIEALLAQREPVYRQADVLINSEKRPLREVAQQVAHQFEQAHKPAGS